MDFSIPQGLGIHKEALSMRHLSDLDSTVKPQKLSELKSVVDAYSGWIDTLVKKQKELSACYNSSIGKTRIKMQTFRIIDENPSHENAASKLVLAAVRFFILAVLIRFKQHSAPPYEATFLPFFSLPLSARRCAMI